MPPQIESLAHSLSWETVGAILLAVGALVAWRNGWFAKLAAPAQAQAAKPAPTTKAEPPRPADPGLSQWTAKVTVPLTLEDREAAAVAELRAVSEARRRVEANRRILENAATALTPGGLPTGLEVSAAPK